jgi:hypothetical protein
VRGIEGAEGSDPAEGEAKFAWGALGAEVVGELEDGSAAGSDGGMGLKSTEGEEAGGLFKGEAGPELAGGGAEDAAAEGGVEGAEAVDFDGYGGVAGGGTDGTASAANGFAGENQLGQEPR